MRLPVRLALVVLGLVAALYGCASLTGGWLGFPPRSEVLPPIVTPEGTATQVLYHDGGGIIGAALIAVGIGLVAFGAWPRARTLRVVSIVFGLAAFLYGVASLTGGWLGTPPWWSEGTVAYDPPTPGTHFSSMSVQMQSAPAREWNSVVVLAFGLGLVAIGAWPRRRQGAVS